MQTSPYSSPPWSSSRGSGSDSPETSSGRSNVVGLSSLQSKGSSKTRTIAVAVEAHLKLRVEPFAYVFNNLVEQKNCKVVVMCCMSRIHDEMGVKHPIDLQTFGGFSKKKLDGAIGSQMDSLNHFLREFRKQLNEKGVELDIRISAGPKSHDILEEAAKAIRPQWVVIDKSFSSRKKDIKASGSIWRKTRTESEAVKSIWSYLWLSWKPSRQCTPVLSRSQILSWLSNLKEDYTVMHKRLSYNSFIICMCISDRNLRLVWSFSRGIFLFASETNASSTLFIVDETLLLLGYQTTCGAVRTSTKYIISLGNCFKATRQPCTAVLEIEGTFWKM